MLSSKMTWTAINWQDLTNPLLCFLLGFTCRPSPKEVTQSIICLFLPVSLLTMAFPQITRVLNILQVMRSSNCSWLKVLVQVVVFVQDRYFYWILIIPIHPHDYSLLGMQWSGLYYYARYMPSGWSSCLTKHKTDYSIHILDDNIVERCAVP